MLKRFIKNFILKKTGAPNQRTSLIRLKELGFNPKTIYDVGAFKGDFAELASNLWPESEILCFEPLKEKSKQIQERFEDDPKIQTFNILLGEKDQNEVTFFEAETASSVLPEHEDNDFKKTKKPMVAIDTLVEENEDVPSPDFLKIDTQGYEYQILLGGENCLEKVEVVLAELNHIDIHEDVILAEKVISYLNSQGFVIYDIAEMHRRPLDNALWQTDFIFVKKSSRFRKNKAWH